MPSSTPDARPSVWQLVAWPAAITLAVTLLRLTGELFKWSPGALQPRGGRRRRARRHRLAGAALRHLVRGEAAPLGRAEAAGAARPRHRGRRLRDRAGGGRPDLPPAEPDRAGHALLAGDARPGGDRVPRLAGARPPAGRVRVRRARAGRDRDAGRDLLLVGQPLRAAAAAVPPGGTAGRCGSSRACCPR